MIQKADIQNMLIEEVGLRKGFEGLEEGE